MHTSLQRFSYMRAMNLHAEEKASRMASKCAPTPHMRPRSTRPAASAGQRSGQGTSSKAPAAVRQKRHACEVLVCARFVNVACNCNKRQLCLLACSSGAPSSARSMAWPCARVSMEARGSENHAASVRRHSARPCACTAPWRGDRGQGLGDSSSAYGVLRSK